MSQGRTRIYQARDADAARGLADKHIADWSDGAEPGPEVPGLPSARCFREDPDPQTTLYGCIATADRWVIEATSLQDFDAAQLIAAQYLLLTAK